MPVVTARKYEGFEAGPNGAAITTANTLLDSVSDPVRFTSAIAHSGSFAAGAPPPSSDTSLGSIAFTGQGAGEMWLWLGIDDLPGYSGSEYPSSTVGGFYVELGPGTNIPICGPGWVGAPEGWDFGDGVTRPPGLYHLSLSFATGYHITPILSPGEVEGRWVRYRATTVDGVNITGIEYSTDTATVGVPDAVNDTGYPVSGWLASTVQGGVGDGIASRVTVIVDDFSLSPLLTARPVVRQYPRTDGRGLASGARLAGRIPTNRIVGGHQ